MAGAVQPAALHALAWRVLSADRVVGAQGTHPQRMAEVVLEAEVRPWLVAEPDNQAVARMGVGETRAATIRVQGVTGEPFQYTNWTSGESSMRRRGRDEFRERAAMRQDVRARPLPQ